MCNGLQPFFLHPLPLPRHHLVSRYSTLLLQIRLNLGWSSHPRRVNVDSQIWPQLLIVLHYLHHCRLGLGLEVVCLLDIGRAGGALYFGINIWQLLIDRLESIHYPLDINTCLYFLIFDRYHITILQHRTEI